MATKICWYLFVIEVRYTSLATSTWHWLSETITQLLQSFEPMLSGTKRSALGLSLMRGYVW